MNSDQSKVDLANSGHQSETQVATNKLDTMNKQQAKKSNIKLDGDKIDESNPSVTSINEKYTSAKQSNPASLKAATKSGTPKTSAKNSTLEFAVTSSTTTSTTTSSLINTVTRSPKLANSDSGIDSTGTDVSPNFVKDLSTHPTNSNASNKRSPINHPATNGSLSESLTSTDGIRTPNSENLSKTNLYIRGLPTSTTDEDLYNMCAKYGTILSTKAIFDKTTGCCRGKLPPTCLATLIHLSTRKFVNSTNFHAYQFCSLLQVMVLFSIPHLNLLKWQLQS